MLFVVDAFSLMLICDVGLVGVVGVKLMLVTSGDRVIMLLFGPRA